LAIFPEDAEVPISAIGALWGTGVSETRTICRRLRNLSLLRSVDRSTNEVQIHDVIRTYLREKIGDRLSDVNQRFLDRCLPPSGRWADLPASDRYLWANLCYHARGASTQTVEELMCDFSYVSAKLGVAGINDLIGDYSWVPPQSPLRLVQGALRLSAHVLAQDKAQLVSQLHARLSDRSGPVASLLKSSQTHTTRPWLRAVRPTLKAPGEGLVRTLVGHTDTVGALTPLVKGRLASGSDDGTLRIWDVDDGRLVRAGTSRAIASRHTGAITALARLGGSRFASGGRDGRLCLCDSRTGESYGHRHASFVEAVAVVDSSTIVSASEDGGLSVWDLAREGSPRRLGGRGIRALASVGGNRVVSGSADGTLGLWDLSLQSYRVLGRIPGPISQIVALSNTRLLSASWGAPTLRVWDLESGTSAILDGHTDSVAAVAAIDSARGVSGAEDGTVRLWEADMASSSRKLDRHHGPVNALAATTDGRLVSCSERDGTLRLWDAETGETSCVFEDPRGDFWKLLHEGLPEMEFDVPPFLSSSTRPPSYQVVLRIEDTSTGAWLAARCERWHFARRRSPQDDADEIDPRREPMTPATRAFDWMAAAPRGVSQTPVPRGSPYWGGWSSWDRSPRIDMGNGRLAEFKHGSSTLQVNRDGALLAAFTLDAPVTCALLLEGLLCVGDEVGRVCFLWLDEGGARGSKTLA
jgi:hypothetical protein